MSNVSMSNADEGPAGGGIKQLVPKIQDHLSHLKRTKRSSIVTVSYTHLTLPTIYSV